MLAQYKIVNYPLPAGRRKGWQAVVDQLRGWRPGDKLLAVTVALGVLSVAGQVLSYVRADYTQTSKAQVEAATNQIAMVSNQMSDLKVATDHNAAELRTDLIARIADLQAQMSRMNDRFDRLPKPEQVAEIKARQVEDEGMIRSILNQLTVVQTNEATHEVRLQNLEKGRDIPLPGRR